MFGWGSDNESNSKVEESRELNAKALKPAEDKQRDSGRGVEDRHQLIVYKWTGTIRPRINAWQNTTEPLRAKEADGVQRNQRMKDETKRERVAPYLPP
jgi:hypothetical protein